MLTLSTEPSQPDPVIEHAIHMIQRECPDLSEVFIRKNYDWLLDYLRDKAAAPSQPEPKRQREPAPEPPAPSPTPVPVHAGPGVPPVTDSQKHRCLQLLKTIHDNVVAGDIQSMLILTIGPGDRVIPISCEFTVPVDFFAYLGYLQELIRQNFQIGFRKPLQ